MKKFKKGKYFEPKFVYPAVAREIMGKEKNIFGIEEAIKYLGLYPTSEQQVDLLQVPYSERVLQFYKKSHVLVVNYGGPIRDQMAMNQKFFYGKNAWYNSEEFAKNRGNVCWNLIRKTEIPGSINKPYCDQNERREQDVNKPPYDQISLLKGNESVPTAQELINAIVAFSLLGERLFRHWFVRVKDIDRYGNCVYIGNSKPTNIQIYKYNKDTCLEKVGLASQIIPM